jgi:hypothetical protein
VLDMVYIIKEADQTTGWERQCGSRWIWIGDVGVGCEGCGWRYGYWEEAMCVDKNKEGLGFYCVSAS